MSMNPTEVSEIISVASFALGLIEKYGMSAWLTLKEAIEATKDKDGPTTEQIEAIYNKCVADNAAIQAS